MDGDVISRLAPTRYDRVAEGLGAFGQHVTTIEELGPAMTRAFDSNRPTIVNVMVSATVNPITTRMLGDPRAEGEISIPYYDNIGIP